MDRVPDELRMEVHDIVQETGSKTIPTKKKCKKAKWLSQDALQIAVKRREVKRNGEKESYMPGAGILHIECILHIAYWVQHFPQHHLSGSGIAQLESYHCLEPAWGAPPMTKVMRKEARHTQRWDRASGVPLEILEHLPPKPESAYFLLCALTYTADLTGGCPPLPFSEKKS